MRNEDKQIRNLAYQTDNSKLADELFWFILDHDDLHKEHFMPIAKKIKKAQTEKTFDHKDFIKEWLPMVDRACLEYYKLNQLEGAPKDIFTKEFRRDMCHRLADQHHRDIEKGEYVLGESGQAQMAGPSGPQYDTTGNQRLESQKQRIDPKCWKGYRKDGTKIKDGVRVNNCVPKESIEEKWSKKYKRSINCSHPKGFSQRAHCAGKKKHNESLEMEMTCPDCGMCQTHSNNITEVKQRLDKHCWKGYRKAGTKLKSQGKGKGKIRVNNCVKVSESWEKEISKYVQLLEKKYR